MALLSSLSQSMEVGYTYSTCNWRCWISSLALKRGRGMEALCERLSPAEVTTGTAKQSWSWLLSVHCGPPSFWQLGGWCEELACTKARIPLYELPKTISQSQGPRPPMSVTTLCFDPAIDRQVLGKEKSTMPKPIEEAGNEVEIKYSEGLTSPSLRKILAHAKKGR